MPTPSSLVSFRLKTYTEVISAMFNTARTTLGKGVDLNRGSVIRTILEAAALQDAEQYVQIGNLLGLFSIDTSKNIDLDRRMLDFGSIFEEDLRRLGALTAVGNVVVGDSALQVAVGEVAADAAAGDTVFTVVQAAAPNDFVTIAGASTFMVSVGSAALGQEERVLVSIIGDVMTILDPLSGFSFVHPAGQPVRLAALSLTIAAGIPAASGAVTLSPTGLATAVFTGGDSIILDRDVPAIRETKVISTVIGDVVSFTAPTTFAHAAGALVHKSTVGTDRTIGNGTEVFVPSSFGTKQIDFITTAAATLLDGDRETPSIPIEALQSGADTRVSSNTINSFKTSPFATATVTNPEATVRGRNREDDPTYRIRGKRILQALSRGTKTAIEARTMGLLDSVSQKSVQFNQIIAPIGFGVSILFITDGSTSFSIIQNAESGREVTISVADSGDRRGRLRGLAPYAFDNAAPASTTPRLFKSVDRGVATAVAVNTLTDTLQVFPGTHVGKFLKTDDDQFYEISGVAGSTLTLIAGGATPSLGAYAIFDFAAAPLVPTTTNPAPAGTDYIFDPTTGDLELTLVNALVTNDALVAADDNSFGVGKYSDTQGLGAFVQKVINGDPADKQNFPGIKAAGTQVFVKSPSIVSPTFQVQIVPVEGFSDSQLAPDAKAAVESVVNANGIGENILISDIIVAVKAITGIKDVKVISPAVNVPILEGELARITSANVTIV